MYCRSKLPDFCSGPGVVYARRYLQRFKLSGHILRTLQCFVSSVHVVLWILNCKETSQRQQYLGVKKDKALGEFVIKKYTRKK